MRNRECLSYRDEVNIYFPGLRLQKFAVGECEGRRGGGPDGLLARSFAGDGSRGRPCLIGKDISPVSRDQLNRIN